LLQECLREWRAAGIAADLGTLLAAASDVSAGPRFDVDDDTFLAPGDMPRRIATALAERGERVPTEPPAIVRAILDSLAHAYAETIRLAADLSGRDLDVVHFVGGGSQNTLLCRLTADALELPVVAGPVEATALGNVLVQASTAGLLPSSLTERRRLVAPTSGLTRYEPTAAST
jgi:rhamnulokinase